MTTTVSAFSASLQRASRTVATQLFDTFAQEGEQFAADWASNARATAGEHGRLYPDSIESIPRLALGIVIDVGPVTSRPQGGMGPGFEFGSRNQPPHLDGANALPMAAARLRTAATVAGLAALP